MSKIRISFKKWEALGSITEFTLLALGSYVIRDNDLNRTGYYYYFTLFNYEVCIEIVDKSIGEAE